MAKWAFIKNLGSLLKTTFKQWSDRDPFTHSATISYYTIFSLPGLLVIIITIAGYFFGTEAVTGQVSNQISGMIGTTAGEDIEKIIANSSETEGSTIASILGVITLLIGATGVFALLQQTLNEIWGVKPKPKKKILKLIRDRVFSFGLILIIGFLLLISLVLSAALSALSAWVAHHVSEALMVVFNVLDIAVSIGIIMLLFAAMFKFLPDAKIAWRDVWVGAFLTAILFVIAKYALGLYFGKTDQASAYGAAGSIILIMLWVTYAGMIVLFGAEFTQVYARSFGKKITPTSEAVFVGDEKSKEVPTPGTKDQGQPLRASSSREK